jgi:hypothetical protein
MVSVVKKRKIGQKSPENFGMTIANFIQSHWTQMHNRYNQCNTQEIHWSHIYDLIQCSSSM